jgi:hypothetical protein
MDYTEACGLLFTIPKAHAMTVLPSSDASTGADVRPRLAPGQTGREAVRRHRTAREAG